MISQKKFEGIGLHLLTSLIVSILLALMLKTEYILNPPKKFLKHFKPSKPPLPYELELSSVTRRTARASLL
jgi:hypothetical protein